MHGRMKISQLIAQLEKIKKGHGDLNVYTQSLTHTWDPELTLRKEGRLWDGATGKPDSVLLNS